MKPRTRRSGGDVKDLPDLVQAQPEVVVKHKNCPLFWRETPEPTLDLIAIDERCDVIRGSRSVDREHSDARDPGAPSACLCVAGVDEHSVEPGIEPVRIAESGQLTPGDHERLLHRILGQADVAEDATRDAEQVVPACASQDGECLPVPALGLFDEIALHSSALSVARIGCAVRAY